MRISALSISKGIAFSIAVIAIMALGQGVAKADQVFIEGYSNGCFNANATGDCIGGVPPDTSSSQTASLIGLVYTNSTFNGTTVAGSLDLNLGSFQLASSLGRVTYTGNTFALRVTFTAPQGIVGGSSQLFSATLTGEVTSAGSLVFINFDNTPFPFTFADATCGSDPSTTCGIGSFSLTVDDVVLAPGQTASLTGHITGATQVPSSIPEPTSMLLLGTGLAGVAAAVRRKLKKVRKH